MVKLTAIYDLPIDYGTVSTIVWTLCFLCLIHCENSAFSWHNPDSKVHGANMGPIWVLSAPDGPHVGPMNLATWVGFIVFCCGWVLGNFSLIFQKHFVGTVASIGLVPVKQPWRIWVDTQGSFCICVKPMEQCYIVTLSLTGWGHTQNDHWIHHIHAPRTVDITKPRPSSAQPQSYLIDCTVCSAHIAK